jgi:ribonuclease E
VRGLAGGRGLIVLLAGALLGLVFLQVSLLKLNTQISENVERAQALERDNAAKRTVISQLDAGRRIQDVAGRLGMACSGGDPAAAASAVDPVGETAPGAAVEAAAAPEAESVPVAETPAAEVEAEAAPVAQEPAPVAEAPAPAAEPAPTPLAQAPAEQAAATGGIAAGDGQ